MDKHRDIRHRKNKQKSNIVFIAIVICLLLLLIQRTTLGFLSISYLPRIAITHLCVVCEKKKKLWRRSDAKEQFPETQLQHRTTRHSRTHLSSQTIVQQLVEFTIDASINRSDTERMTLSDLNAYVLRKYVLLYINLRSTQTTDSCCFFFSFLF